MASSVSLNSTPAASKPKNRASSGSSQQPKDLLGQLRVNRNSSVPIYHQIKEQILDAIADEQLKVGDLLPSERELVEHLNVSRMTIHRALSELAMSGQLQTRPGKGTYVQSAKLVQRLGRLAGFSADMRRSGHTVSSRVLRNEVVPADAKLAELLQLQPGDPVVILERVRAVDDVPTGWDRSHLPASLCPDITRFDFSNASLYDTLRREYKLNLSWARQTLEATLSNWREQQLLLVPEGAPILLGERTLYLDGDVIIEYSKASYRADRYRYDIELVGDYSDERK